MPGAALRPSSCSASPPCRVAQLDVLSALSARRRDVHVSLLHPSGRRLAAQSTGSISAAPTRPCAAGAPTPRSRSADQPPAAQLVGPPEHAETAATRARPASRRSRVDAVDVEPHGAPAATLARTRPRRPRAPTGHPTPFALPTVATRAFRFTPVTARSASSRCSAMRSATCSSLIHRCAPTTCVRDLPRPRALRTLCRRRARSWARYRCRSP